MGVSVFSSGKLSCALDQSKKVTVTIDYDCNKCPKYVYIHLITVPISITLIFFDGWKIEGQFDCNHYLPENKTGSWGMMVNLDLNS